MKKVFVLLSFVLPFCSCFGQNEHVVPINNQWKDAGYKMWPQPQPFGLIFKQTHWEDFANYSTQTGFAASAASATISGGFMNTTAPGFAYANTIRVLPQRPTDFNYDSIDMVFKINQWSASSFEFGLGFKGLINGSSFGVLGFVQTTSSGSPGLFIYSETGTAMASGATGSTTHLGDIIHISLTLNDTIFTLAYNNVTTGGSVTTQSYTYPSNQSQILLNSSEFCIFEGNGDAALTAPHQIQSLAIYSKEIKNPNLFMGGDSKTKIGFADNWANRWPEQLGPLYPPFAFNAGSAETLLEAFNRRDELTAFNPSQVILGFLGENDVREGVPVANVMDSLTTLVNWYAAGGTQVLFMCFPEDTTAAGGFGLTAYKNAIVARWPNQIIDTWDSLSTNNVLKSIYNHGDNIHFNGAAMNKIVQAAVASNKISQIDPNRRAPTRTYDGQIRASGDSSYLLVPERPIANQVMQWDTFYRKAPSIIRATPNYVMVNNAYNPAASLPTPSNLSFYVNGGILSYGNLGSIYVLDRTTPANYINIYMNGGIYKENVNGTDRVLHSLTGAVQYLAGNSTALDNGVIQIRGTRSTAATNCVGPAGILFNGDSCVITPTGNLNYGIGYSFTRPTFTPAVTENISNPWTVYIPGAPIAGNGNANFATPKRAFVIGGDTTELDGPLQIKDGTQSNGFVFTSDANGKGSWQAASSSSQTLQQVLTAGSTLTGNNAINTGTGTFGITSSSTSQSAIVLQASSGDIVLSTGSTTGTGLIFSGSIYLSNPSIPDANLTMSDGQPFFDLQAGITANRTITLPTGSADNGRLIYIHSPATSGFTWSFTTSVAYPDGTTITTLRQNTFYVLQSVGNAWTIINEYGPSINYHHTIFTPSTGGTVALLNNRYNIINPSGTLATLTVNLPSSPLNNDVVYIKFTQAVTAVTYGNGTVVDGITAPTAGGLTVLTFDSGTTSWY